MITAKYFADESCDIAQDVRGLTPEGYDSDFNLSEDCDGIIDFHDKPKKVGRPFGPHTSAPYVKREYHTHYWHKRILGNEKYFRLTQLEGVRDLSPVSKHERKTELRHARIAAQTPQEKRAKLDHQKKNRAERPLEKLETERTKR